MVFDWDLERKLYAVQKSIIMLSITKRSSQKPLTHPYIDLALTILRFADIEA